MEQETIQQKVLRLSSSAHGVINIDEVYVDESRIRKDDDKVRRYIDEELAPSIAEKGVIQPSTIHKCAEPITHKGVIYEYELVAGWCRMQACAALGLKQIPYNLQEKLTGDQLLELELEENEIRLDMTWQDRCLAIEKIHKRKAREHGAVGEKWGYRETGKLLGVSYGNVSDTLKIAGYLRNGDGEVNAAGSMGEAMNILLKRKEQALIDDLSARAMPATAKKRTVGHVTTANPIGDLTPSPVSAPVPRGSESESVIKKSMVEKYEVDLSDMLFNMPNEEWFAGADAESVDLVYTDIPYGIDMDNLDFQPNKEKGDKVQGDLASVYDEHDVDENVEQMKPFLEGAYKVLKDGKYCVFWYDIKHQEKLHKWALEAGFTVQPYPLIWCKEHPCRNRAGNIWWTKSIEYVFVCRKGKGTLRSPQTRCWFLADGSAERKTQQNPFSKPFAVSKQIIEPLTIPGDLVLDCYAGEGSLVRCALNMGRRVIAVEKKKEHFVRLQEHVRKVYVTMTNDKVKFL
jgi:DNA modification methylase